MVNTARRLDFDESDEEIVGFTSGSEPGSEPGSDFDSEPGSEPGSDSDFDFDTDSETEEMEDGMQTPLNYAEVGPNGLRDAPSPQPLSPVQTGTPQNLVNIQMVLQFLSPVATPPRSPQFH